MVAGTPSSAPGIAPMIQLLVALAIVVVLLKWLAPKLYSKVLKERMIGSASGLAITQSCAIGSTTFCLIRTNGKCHLVAVSPQACTCLNWWNEDLDSASEAPAFFELMDAAREPNLAGGLEQNCPENLDFPEALGATRRLAVCELGEPTGDEDRPASRRLERLIG